MGMIKQLRIDTCDLTLTNGSSGFFRNPITL